MKAPLVQLAGDDGPATSRAGRDRERVRRGPPGPASAARHETADHVPAARPRAARAKVRSDCEPAGAVVSAASRDPRWAERYACTSWTAIEPSPTADATRFTEPARTSPAASTPG